MGFVTGMLTRNAASQHQPRRTASAGSTSILQDAASRVPLDRYATLYNKVIRPLDDEGFGLFSDSMRLAV